MKQDKENKEPNTIVFHNANVDWVMRITADRRIEVNEDVEVTEAAQKVLDALQQLLTAQRTELAPEGANSKQYLERLIRIMGTFDLATGHADTFDELLDSLESELRDVLGYYRQQRTWVGLTPEEILDMFDAENVYGSKWLEFAKAVENKLKEKNT